MPELQLDLTENIQPVHLTHECQTDILGGRTHHSFFIRSVSGHSVSVISVLFECFKSKLHPGERQNPKFEERRGHWFKSQF